jgi:hypothetical protein
MTASVGREVDANLLPGAALGSAQARVHAQDAGGQDLGDLIEALGGSHKVGPEGTTPELRPRAPGGLVLFHAGYLPVPQRRCRAAARGEDFECWTMFWFCVSVAGSGSRLPAGC